MNRNRMIRTVNFIVALAGAAVLAGCGGADTDPAASATAAVQRTTESGPVRGYRDARTQTLAWLGLPYAKAPVGALRWKPPVPPETSTAVRDTVSLHRVCPRSSRGNVDDRV